MPFHKVVRNTGNIDIVKTNINQVELKSFTVEQEKYSQFCRLK
jgi:hypothetical protein